MDTNKQKKNKNKPTKRKVFYIIVIWLLIYSFVIWLFLYFVNGQNNIESIKKEIEKKYDKQEDFETFYKDIKDKKIEIVKIGIPNNNYTNTIEAIIIDPKNRQKIKTLKIFKLPTKEWADYKKEIEDIKKYIGIWLYSNLNPKIEWWKIIWNLIFPILIIGYIIFMIKTMKGWWSSNIKKFNWWNEENKIKLDDIWWIESIKNEIDDIMQSLNNWENFKKKWVRLPRWMLFYWPAWVGKTMIAKAIASSLNLDMFIATWNDFRSKFLWQWAANVHSTFKKIRKSIDKKNQLSILFIDEIDTIFKKRGSWHSEDDTVVNAFLHEMDGIEWNSNIIVIWATNHLEKIDEALLSRIDKKLAFKLPTRWERLDIIKKILKNIQKKDKELKVKENIDLNIFASNTMWLSWRDIDNILNEVHRVSVIEWKIITESLIQEVFSDYILWKDNTWIDVHWKDKEVVTYHELWHGIIWYLNWKQVHTISIIPKWPALWLTWSIDREEKVLKTPEDIIKEIQELLWGRMAEYLFIGREITTGSSNDYERASKLAFSYFKDYNFSYKKFQLWFILNKNNNDNALIEANINSQIEKEVKKLLQDQEKIVLKTLKKHKKEIEQLANILKEKEIIQEKQIIQIVKK